MFEFWGIRFVLNLRGETMPEDLFKVIYKDEDWKDSRSPDMGPLENVRFLSQDRCLTE